MGVTDLRLPRAAAAISEDDRGEVLPLGEIEIEFLLFAAVGVGHVEFDWPGLRLGFVLPAETVPASVAARIAIELSARDTPGLAPRQNGLRRVNATEINATFLH